MEKSHLVPPEVPETEINRKRNIRKIRLFLIKLFLFAFMLFVTFGVVFGITVVPNADMQPRISAGDIVFFYRKEENFGDGDVVVYQKQGKTFVARIVAIPNDSIEITKGGVLFINESQVIENSIYYHTYPFEDAVQYPLQLNESEYFLLGDYREGAKDSRYYGAVSENEIIGKVITAIRRNNL